MAYVVDRPPLVVVARPADVLATLPLRLLDPAERRRARALAQAADRTAFLAAHLLVRWCAAALTGRPIEALAVAQRCPSCGGEGHGRPGVPTLPALQLSLSRTRVAVAAAAAWGPVGVDVEPVHGAAVLAASPLALSAEEHRAVLGSAEPATAFTRAWVRKECLVKAGAVTLDRLAEVSVSGAPDVAGLEGWSVHRHGPLLLLDRVDPSLGVVSGVAAQELPTVLPFP